MLFDYDTIRIAAIGNSSKVNIWRIVGEGHMRTVLLKTGLALGAVTIGVNHAADCRNIAGFKLADCRADLGDTANDLVSRNARIDSWHSSTPLTTNGVEVRVAYAAEKDFDLNIMFSWIASRDGDWSKC
jgi:hypothetical protein